MLDWLDDALALGTGLYNLFTESESEQASREIGEAGLRSLRQAEEYQRAALDPTHPLFRKIAGEETEAINRTFADSMNDIMRMHARARARGTPGFFINPERRDEAIAAATALRRETAQEAARTKTRQYLMNAAQANRASAGAYSTVGQPVVAAGQAAGQRQAGGLEQIYDVTKGFLNAFNERPRATTSSSVQYQSPFNYEIPTNNPTISL